jgi:hypothetical protein
MGRELDIMARILRSLYLAPLLCRALMAQSESPPSDASLTVQGDIPRPVILTKADMAKMPRSSLTLDGHGTPVIYEGVLLYEILKRAGAPLDKELSGKALASYVLAEARDGYQVVYTLAELDPAFTGNKILVADTVNSQPLPQRLAPFHLVVPNEKKAARSVRMLERLTVVRLRK